MRLARRYLISGRVQGVGFRFFVEAVAGREGLHGWVRNTPDGVEIRAEGDVEALTRFEHAVHRGPLRARVDHVDVTDVGADGVDSGFTIRETAY
jgi:acylphosphatase